MRKKPFDRSKIFLSAAIAAFLFLTCLLPVQTESAGLPSVVNGRILTKDKTGDCSDWVEVAKSDNFSLIVRKNYLVINTNPLYYNNLSAQITAFGTTTAYHTSNTRKLINAWFNGCAAGAADNLPLNARLRNFTVQHNALQTLGTTCDPKTSLINGLSSPTNYQVGKGDDIAFAMSYGEAASFVSKKHFMRLMNPSLQLSNSIASANYDKLYFPVDPTKALLYGMWLRSPGDCPGTAGSLSDISYYGAVFQANIAIHPREKTLVYPALWVNSSIFENKATINVYHKDATSLKLLKEEHYSINPGCYGPYNALTFPNYGKGYLATYSDPHYGTVKADETKNITYLYPPAIKTVDVTYYPNGGFGNSFTDTVPANSNYTIRSNDFQPPDSSLQFDRWNTKPNGLGTNYTSGQVVYLTTSLTLYAQWKPIVSKLTVTYYPNGGIGNVITDTVPANSNYTIRSNSFQSPHSSLQFDRWNTRSDGLGINYTSGQVVYMTASLALYAQWKPVESPPLYVIYDPNGGIGNVNVVQVTANTNYIIQNQGYTHLKPGTTFDGWNTLPNGTGTNYKDNDVVNITNNLILYAKWRHSG